RLRGGGPRPAARRLGRGGPGHPERRRRRRLPPRGLPALRGPVLLPGRRQGRRPRLRPPVRLLTAGPPTRRSAFRRRGCLVHAVVTGWMRHPRCIRGAGPGIKRTLTAAAWLLPPG